MDLVVTVAVERVPPQTHASTFVVVYLGSGWIGAGIEFGIAQARVSGDDVEAIALDTTGTPMVPRVCMRCTVSCTSALGSRDRIR
jgi:hypothetical protein